jgi:hypothetical protein
MSFEKAQALIAAFTGDDAWRSIKAKLQRRDRYGKFAEMGGGFSFNLRLGNGEMRRVSGTIVGESGTEDIDIDVKDNDTLTNGIYSVPSAKGEAVKAIVPKSALEKIDKKKVKKIADDVYVDVADIKLAKKPKSEKKTKAKTSTKKPKSPFRRGQDRSAKISVPDPIDAGVGFADDKGGLEQRRVSPGVEVLDPSKTDGSTMVLDTEDAAAKFVFWGGALNQVPDEFVIDAIEANKGAKEDGFRFSLLGGGGGINDMELLVDNNTGAFFGVKYKHGNGASYTDADKLDNPSLYREALNEVFAETLAEEFGYEPMPMRLTKSSRKHSWGLQKSKTAKGIALITELAQNRWGGRRASNEETLGHGTDPNTWNQNTGAVLADLRSYARMRLFDTVIGNVDRHGRNYMLKKREDGNYDVIPIDHSLAFMDADSDQQFFEPLYRDELILLDYDLATDEARWEEFVDIIGDLQEELRKIDPAFLVKKVKQSLDLLDSLFPNEELYKRKDRYDVVLERYIGPVEWRIDGLLQKTPEELALMLSPHRQRSRPEEKKEAEKRWKEVASKIKPPDGSFRKIEAKAKEVKSPPKVVDTPIPEKSFLRGIEGTESVIPVTIDPEEYVGLLDSKVKDLLSKYLPDVETPEYSLDELIDLMDAMGVLRDGNDFVNSNDNIVDFVLKYLNNSPLSTRIAKLKEKIANGDDPTKIEAAVNEYDSFIARLNTEEGKEEIEKDVRRGFYDVLATVEDIMTEYPHMRGVLTVDLYHKNETRRAQAYATMNGNNIVTVYNPAFLSSMVGKLKMSKAARERHAGQVLGVNVEVQSERAQNSALTAMHEASHGLHFDAVLSQFGVQTGKDAPPLAEQLMPQDAPDDEDTMADTVFGSILASMFDWSPNVERYDMSKKDIDFINRSGAAFIANIVTGSVDDGSLEGDLAGIIGSRDDKPVGFYEVLRAATGEFDMATVNNLKAIDKQVNTNGKAAQFVEYITGMSAESLINDLKASITDDIGVDIENIGTYGVSSEDAFSALDGASTYARTDTMEAFAEARTLLYLINSMGGVNLFGNEEKVKNMQEVVDKILTGIVPDIKSRTMKPASARTKALYNKLRMLSLAINALSFGDDAFE